MSILDTEKFLGEIDADNPCGPNIEYEPDFVAFDQILQGRAEAQFGAAIIEAVGPEWKQVKGDGLALLEKSRDLRIVVPLSRALLNLSGWAGFGDGLHLARELLERYWDFVHPQLDPDDDLDPTLRVNCLAGYADYATMIQDLRQQNFVVLPGIGGVTVRDLEVIEGEVQPQEGEEVKSSSGIDSAIHDMNLEQLGAAVAVIRRIDDDVTAMETILMDKVGSFHVVDMSLLKKIVRRALEFLLPRYETRTQELGAQSEAAPSGAVSSGSGVAKAISGEIASRQDVVRMIEKICSYYEKYELSSPVPMVLDRARRLVTMSFMEIIEDLAPDGKSQVMVISGRRENKES